MFFKILICLPFIISCAYSIKERIIGGADALRIDFPYQAVLRRISDNLLIGGGAIISHKHILTAAHCVDDRFISHANLKVSLGNANATHQFTSEYLPNRIYLHPQYTGGFNTFMAPNNDIAIIKVRENIEFNRFQNMINLPSKNIESAEMGIVTGWGTITHPGIRLPNTLQQAWMTIIDTIICKPRFPIDIYDDQFCALNAKGVGPCIGDGGTPLARNGIVIGIFSMSYLCAEGIPDVYTNVYSHINFIRLVLRT